MAQDHSVFSNIQDNRTSSLAEQVADQINQVIIDQNINAGEKLPNEFELAARLNVGRGTIQMCIRDRVSAISRERAFTAATRPRWVVRTGTLRTSLISAVPALAKMPLVST